jgi:hypothetical protein
MLAFHFGARHGDEELLGVPLATKKTMAGALIKTGVSHPNPIIKYCM